MLHSYVHNINITPNILLGAPCSGVAMIFGCACDDIDNGEIEGVVAPKAEGSTSLGPVTVMMMMIVIYTVAYSLLIHTSTRIPMHIIHCSIAYISPSTWIDLTTAHVVIFFPQHHQNITRLTQNANKRERHTAHAHLHAHT